MSINNNSIASLLHKLDPAGHQGFEGLIAQLMEALTGRRFYLARSGRQEGRDMNSNAIAVECKRYDQGTPLKEDELTSKLVHAIDDFPLMESWILATSHKVESPLINRLQDFGRKEGVDVIAVSSDDGNPSSLAVLCANAINVVKDFTNSKWEPDDQRELLRLLEEVRELANYETRLKLLENELNSPSLGLGHLRVQANYRLMEKFSSEGNSRAEFHQPLHVLSESAFIVQRNSAMNSLDTWYASWPTQNDIFVLTGEEGDGKTWAVASWVANKIRTDQDFPTVFFFPSLNVGVYDLDKLISERLKKISGHESHPDFWHKRLERWKHAEPGKSPLMLLVFDGINERNDSSFWKILFDKMNDETWRERVAIVVTCRTKYWERHFALLEKKVNHAKLGPLSPPELNQALKMRGLSNEDFPRPLLDLMSKPRYLDMAVKYRESMASCGDYTVARLIYEDWRYRLINRPGIGIDLDSFEDFVKDLAETQHRKGGILRGRDIDEIMPAGIDTNAVLEELRTGGVLEGKGDKYTVNEHRLILGFGLLLADEAKAPDLSVERIHEIIAGWLEPSGSDLQAKICGMAVCIVMDTPDYSRIGRYTLLQAWIEFQNPYAEFEDDFQAYLPKDPELYFDLTEYYWTRRRELHSLEPLLIFTIVRWAQKRADIFELLPARIEKWLSYISINGVPWMGGQDPVQKKIKHQEVSKRAGQELVAGKTLDKYGRRFILVDDDDLYFIWRAVFGIISCLKVEPFIGAIATGCLSDEIVGYPEKHSYAAWVINGYEKSVSDLVIREAEKVAGYGDITAQRAAFRLLGYEASDKSISFRTDLPKNLFPVPEYILKYQEDPCLSFFSWARVDCERCLSRDDVPIEQVVRNIKRYSSDPSLPKPEGLVSKIVEYAGALDLSQVKTGMGNTEEDILFDDIELVLSHYAPVEIARLIKAIVASVEERDGISLRVLARYLMKTSLILGPEEHAVVRRAWEKIVDAPAPWNRENQLIEENIAATVLKGLSASEQLDILLARPNDAFDWKDLENSFKPVENWDKVKGLLSGDETRRVWITLWFISVDYTAKIPRDVLELILPYTVHEDVYLRRTALKILRNAQIGNPRSIIPVDWGWTPESDYEESYFGSLLLAEATELLSYQEACGRISPEFLSYALKGRTVKDDKEVTKHILQAQSQYLREKDKSENYQLNNELFGLFLDDISKEDSELFKTWIQPVLNKPDDIPIFRYQLIYDAFCRKLLNDRPELGIKLYRILNKSRLINTNVSGVGCSFTDKSLFEAPAHVQVIELWNEWAGNAKTDEDLLILVLMTEDNESARKWLMERIARDLESDVLYFKARCFMLMGFIGVPNDEINERSKSKRSGRWLDEVAETAESIRQKDEWAKQWYERFLSHEDDSAAWAAFRLFLQCVDRRFWHWKKALEMKYAEAATYKMRRPFYLDNKDEISHAIKKNEEEYSKKLLGHKVERGQLWPWMNWTN